MSNYMLRKVIRYLANEAGKKEIEEVLSWKENNWEEYERIKQVFENVPFENETFNVNQRKNEVLQKIYSITEKQIEKRKIQLSYWLKVAAVFAGLIAFGFSTYLYNNSLYFEKSNLSSQNEAITLPDGSVVTLDKNATLSYKNDWFNRFTREVDISGKAYFEIISTGDHHNFRVNFDASQLEVLGTKFIVSDNYGNAQVVLDEGRVKVTSYKINKSFVLTNPGEQLLVTSEGNVKQGIINQNLYFSWLDEKLNFNNCSIAEAIDFLKDSYNLKLEMNDNNALNKKLYGSAPSDNPDLIIEAIARITDKKVEKSDGVIKVK